MKPADGQEIVAHYVGTQSAAQTATALGVSPCTVLKYAKAAGVLRGRGGVRKYAFDEAFFSAYTPASCYWAGFLAADGALVLSRGAHRIQLLLTRSDSPHLEAFKRSAGVEHPIKDVVLGGYEESVVIVSSHVWWDALHTMFNVTQRKSFTLQPPPIGIEPFRWHFLRGYFDGDGSVHNARNEDGGVKQIEMVSGSRPFVEWAQRLCFSHHAIRADRRVWRLALSGEVMRSTVRDMYAGSTPDTRLGRKYDLLKHLLVVE
jgi:hypothetical protein